MMPSDSQWLIVSVKEPVMFHQTADETWLFNPNRRYVVNANRVKPIQEFIETTSDLEGASLYTRLTAGKNITGAKILVERNRERGLGDLLFLTGPLAFLNHVSGSDVQIDVMAFADRGLVLTHSPLIHNRCVKCGPLEYDHLRHYNYHWLIRSVTEYNMEGDQLNVYDALYQQLGFDPQDIEAKWKRPSATLVADDFQNLDRLYRYVWEQRKLDLRRIGYIVVAPFANATSRCLNYQRWLEIIKTISTRRPVVVIGNSHLRLPDMDMSAGEFNQHVSTIGGGVFNAVDSTSVRSMMALIARSFCVVGLDSAPIYIAQALNVPAISIWGTHPPGSRIGYDKNMMDLAIWNQDACQYSPCFAYGEFPVNKCPNGIRQTCCEVISSVSVDDVLKRVDAVESASAQLGKFATAAPVAKT
jgi:ADP-heptose:LPS heptosyltransferase